VGGWVYIMASAPYGTLYVGVTNNIARHAIHREKRIKTWPRQWKINLIEAGNPKWEDLHERINW
jgi:putative endonuclease